SGAGAGWRAVGDAEAGEAVGAGAGVPVEHDPPGHRVEHADVVYRGDLPGLVEVAAAVERAGQEEHALAGLDVGAFPDDVDHARAVGPDGAALPPAGLGVVGGRAELGLAPGAATVGRGAEPDGLG